MESKTKKKKSPDKMLALGDEVGGVHIFHLTIQTNKFKLTLKAADLAQRAPSVPIMAAWLTKPEAKSCLST